jgi:hypothetical protein
MASTSFDPWCRCPRTRSVSKQIKEQSQQEDQEEYDPKGNYLLKEDYKRIKHMPPTPKHQCLI